MTKTIVQVLLPLPFGQGFDYRVPKGMALEEGSYVRVPFGKKTLAGVVWGTGEGEVPPEKLKTILHCYTDVSPMRAPMRRFLAWVARYNLAELGSVLKMALPVPDALEEPKRKVRMPSCEPRAAQDLRNNKDPALPAGAAPQDHGTSLNPAQARAAAQLAARLDKGFGATLLDGVTGSGKTEVYFDTIARTLEESAGRNQILVLLPEIALSVQWLARFERRFGFQPYVWHSDVSRARKKRIYRSVAKGEACVVVGARSALFLPFTRLRLIVVDEEHEASYKQEDGVFYHARDMAVARAKEEDIPIVLVSATPSLETLVNVERGRYAKLHLPERHAAARLPEIALVDMRGEALDADHFLSAPLVQALAETLNAKRQSLLFLNRRGYAPLVLCRACGHRFQCPNCTAWLVMHGKVVARDACRVADVGNMPAPYRVPRTAQLRCHHCDHRQKAPQLCPACGTENSLHPCGPGVERLADEVARRFPSARLAVISSDEIAVLDAEREAVHVDKIASPVMEEVGASAPGGGDISANNSSPIPAPREEAGGNPSLAAALQAIECGAVDIVIGTQILAKGHHFPNLALVGIVDADLGLSGGDLRAGERSFQLLQQISGRAGRENAVEGVVLVQTYFPDHPVMAALANADREAFLALEKAQRRQSFMPPYGRLAALILDGPSEQEVKRFALAAAALAPRLKGVDILGPAPAPMVLLRGRWRYRFLIRAALEVKIQDVITGWLAKVPIHGALRIRADIDPMSFY